MKIHTQRFVTKTDLFANLPIAESLWDNADHSDITWGDANRTLIHPQRMIDWCTDDSDSSDTDIDILLERLDSLNVDGPDGPVMIDLEN